MKECYLCGSSEKKTVFIENGIDIVKCAGCGHVYSTWEQDEHYDGYWDDAEEAYDLQWWDNAHREIYNDFIKIFMKKSHGNLLDVGCGLGFFVKTLGEKKPEWLVTGYEISEKAVKFAREKNGLNNVYAGMVQNSGLPPNSQDIITLWDVIEHIPNPGPLMEYLYSLLKPGGILFMQTPNYPIQIVKARLKVALKGMKPDGHYLEAKDHIHIYGMNTLRTLGKKFGFREFKYYVLKPIAAVSGGSGVAGVIFKKLYYYATSLIWDLGFHTINLNNTLFVTFKK